MFDAPLALAGRTFSDSMDAAKADAHEFGLDAVEGERARSKRLGAERRAEFAQPPCCCLCDSDVEDPYHVLVTCSDAATVGARAKFLRSVPDLLAHLVLASASPPSIGSPCLQAQLTGDSST